MDDVNKKVDQLIEAIKKSEIYREYRRCESEMTKQPALKEQIDEYRRRAYLLSASDNVDVFEEADRLENEFETIRRNPIVNSYLEAELSLCRTLQRINLRIDSEVGLSVPDV